MWYMCKMKYNTVKNDHLLTKEAQQKSPTGKKKKKTKDWKQYFTERSKFPKFIDYQGDSNERHVLLLQFWHKFSSDAVETLRSKSLEHLPRANRRIRCGQQFGTVQ